MKYLVIQLFALIMLASCANTDKSPGSTASGSEIMAHSQGLSITRHHGFSIVTVKNPWPGASKDYVYVLKRQGAQLADSLKNLPVVNVPVKNIVVTSTTHIPSLEMLGVENTLLGFPNLSYISSEKIRARIDAGTIRELGSNQQMNLEAMIDLQPDVVIGYGIDDANPMLEKLKNAGLKVIVNGDWNEQSPLGKAEWLKLYGELFGLEEKAAQIFKDIEDDYLATLKLARTVKSRPSVIAGAVFEDRWYLPQGKSWGALTIKDAGGNYLWADTDGTGSHSLPFETVLAKGSDADVWIGPAQFTSLSEMKASNPHYSKFKAFNNGEVYSFSTKKGKTGGIVYYELAPNRPDLVLKDVLKILHPELLPQHKLFFFEKLK